MWYDGESFQVKRVLLEAMHLIDGGVVMALVKRIYSALVSIVGRTLKRYLHPFLAKRTNSLNNGQCAPLMSFSDDSEASLTLLNGR
jgi:hypothetical protein